MEVKGQLYGVSSLLLPLSGSLGLNLGHQACGQSTLPAEPSCGPAKYLSVMRAAVGLVI